ncbi:transposase [Streptomyces sp. NPDC048606]|uniref:transposase n=1 Tax=Streptomyces sp. NPDC048606 TaxID=3154726 RepID=UPI003428640B
MHLAADRQCRPLALVLTVGQAGDSPQFIPVLAKVRVRLPVGRPRTTPGAVAADKAYSSRGNRAYLRKRGIKAVIPEEGRTRRPAHQPRSRPLQGTEHRRTPDQQAESLARHRHPLRQNPGQLPRWSPPPRRHDLGRRPPQTHRMITTSHRP